MAIAEGTQFGPYRLLEKIGAGGMGEVYRVLDTRLEREVALKLVSATWLATEAGTGSPTPQADTPGPSTPHSGSNVSHERFLREARSAATLNHPNVCAIYDTGEQDGRPYLVMELLRGMTLKRYLFDAGGKGLPPAEVVLFAQQAAAALAAAHGRGIIHRDIKPANLFVVDALRGKRQIKILDFGLAKKQRGALSGSGSGNTDETGIAPGSDTMELTSPGSAVGTVSYMSPEQARGLPLDARSDLFSLGTVIFEMATGKTPFAGASAADVFVSLLREEPPPVSFVNPAMPKRLDAIVEKLLRKDPAQRYASAEQLEEDLEHLETPVAPVAPVTGTVTVAETEPPAPRSKWPWAVLVAVLLLAAGGLAWWKFRPAPATPAESSATPQATAGATRATKDSIILADFVNHTGDPVFDTTLNQALEIDLEQSPVLNIVSQEHLAQSVKYLGKPQGTPVTPQIAREIGEREGIKAIITGTIANLGKEYVITLTAQNTATGDEIVSEQAQAADKEHVLDALGKAASALRGKLGEDLESIKKLDTPFGQATTSSLEAFRAYALGDKEHVTAHDIPEAEGHYLRAVELDPNFAMAFARLGVVYINSGQVGKANHYFQKAYELSKNVSERERFYITGHYEENVTGNLAKVVEILQEAIQAYPNQIDNYININVAYQALGQYEKGLVYARKAVELDPQDSIAAENLLADLTTLGRLEEARTELERIRRLGLNTSTGDLVTQIVTYYMLGEKQHAQALLNQVAGKPDEFSATGAWASAQQYAGQYREASATINKAIEQAGRAKAPDVQAGLLLADATALGMVGTCQGNEEKVKRALSLDKSRQTQTSATLAAAVCGGSKFALSLLKDLSKKFPQDTLIQDVFGPLTRAYLALEGGRLQEAVDSAEPAKSNDTNFPGSYVQGLACLKMHDATRAQNAFQTALRANSGALQLVFNPFYAQVQLGSAQAYAMAGDKENAKKAYEAFFKTWKDADPDLPMLVAAKKDYASL